MLRALEERILFPLQKRLLARQASKFLLFDFYFSIFFSFKKEKEILYIKIEHKDVYYKPNAKKDAFKLKIRERERDQNEDAERTHMPFANEEKKLN